MKFCNKSSRIIQISFIYSEVFSWEICDEQKDGLHELNRRSTEIQTLQRICFNFMILEELCFEQYICGVRNVSRDFLVINHYYYYSYYYSSTGIV
jgi:hypothetical protein